MIKIIRKTWFTSFFARSGFVSSFFYFLLFLSFFLSYFLFFSSFFSTSSLVVSFSKSFCTRIVNEKKIAGNWKWRVETTRVKSESKNRSEWDRRDFITQVNRVRASRSQKSHLGSDLNKHLKQLENFYQRSSAIISANCIISSYPALSHPASCTVSQLSTNNLFHKLIAWKYIEQSSYSNSTQHIPVW